MWNKEPCFDAAFPLHFITNLKETSFEHKFYVTICNRLNLLWKTIKIATGSAVSCSFNLFLKIRLSQTDAMDHQNTFTKDEKKDTSVC